MISMVAKLREDLRHLAMRGARHCPTLLTHRGIGPDNAAYVMTDRETSPPAALLEG